MPESEENGDHTVAWNDANHQLRMQEITDAQREQAQLQRAQSDMDQHIHNHTAQLPGQLGSLAADTVTTTTWNVPVDVTADDLYRVQDGVAIQDVPGALHPITTATPGGVNMLHVNTDSSVNVNEEQIKRCMHEVLKELFREDDCFMQWLRVKYAIVESEKPKKKRKKRARPAYPGAESEPIQSEYIVPAGETMHFDRPDGVVVQTSNPTNGTISVTLTEGSE